MAPHLMRLIRSILLGENSVFNRGGIGVRLRLNPGLHLYHRRIEKFGKMDQEELDIDAVVHSGRAVGLHDLGLDSNLRQIAYNVNTLDLISNSRNRFGGQC